MVKEDKVGIGVIGCGVIGKGGHLKHYKNNPHAKIVAVCDTIEGRAKEAAKRFDAEAWYLDYHDLLQRNDIQGVSICTPHPLHAAPSIAAAKAGKHILCEKPMCSNLKDANAVVDAVRKNNVKFLMGYTNYFMPTMQRSKKIIDEGLLGKIHEISRIGGGHQDGNQDADWFYSKWAGGGVTFDWTTYTLYMFRYLIGKIRTVFAQSAINQPYKKSKDKPGTLVKMEVEDTISILMRFENDAIGLIYDSWSSPVGHGYTEIIGFDGALTMDLVNEEMNLYTNKVQLPDYLHGWNKLIMPEIHRFDAYQARVDHFVDCIINNKEPAVSVEMGRDVMEVTEAAYISNRQNRLVELPINPSP
jgi:predicted dehydrogenase